MAQAWEYDGVDLTRSGYNVRLLGGPLSTPPRRSDNLVVPHKDGRVWVAKALDSRVQTLAMWAISEPAAGGTESEANMLANLDVLRGLFARPGQHTLKHQFGSVTRLATVEVVRQVEFEPKVFNAAYVFMVEFLMADPLWYAEAATTVGPTVIYQSPQNITVTSAGSYRSDKAIFTIAGTITNPKLAIGAYWVQYTGTVGSGQSLVINCGTFTATLDGADVSGLITHEGGTVWLPVAAGANSLAVTCSGTPGGSVTVTFTAPYV
jgi:hypothetical protein